MVIFTDRTMNRKSFGLAWVRWPGPSPPSYKAYVLFGLKYVKIGLSSWVASVD